WSGGQSSGTYTGVIRPQPVDDAVDKPSGPFVWSEVAAIAIRTLHSKQPRWVWMTAALIGAATTLEGVFEDITSGRLLGAPNLPRTLDDLARVAREQRGLLTREQCLAAGLSAGAIRWRLNRRRWITVHRGVYL